MRQRYLTSDHCLMTLTFQTLSESSITTGLPTDWKTLMRTQLVKTIK